MKYILILFILLILGLAIFIMRKPKSGHELKIGDKATFSIEIADNAVSRAQGLSGRKEMEQGTGLLFKFSSAKTRHFWMKDMHFPLDFLWIRDGVIVGIDENVPHPAGNDGKTARVKSAEAADMVLEVNGGEVGRHQIRVGDEVRLSL